MDDGKELRMLRREVRELKNIVLSLSEQLANRETARQNNLVTTTEFAKLHGISRRVVANRIKNGLIGAVKRGRCWYIEI